MVASAASLARHGPGVAKGAARPENGSRETGLMTYRRSFTMAGLSAFTAIALMMACSGSDDDASAPETTTDSGQSTDTSSTIDPTPPPSGPDANDEDDQDASTRPTDASTNSDADGGPVCTSEANAATCENCCKAAYPLGWVWNFEPDAGTKCSCRSK